MLKVIYTSVIRKFLGLLLIALICLISFQPLTYADNLPEQNLAKIDRIRFNKTYPINEYNAELNLLSDRCATTPEHVSDMSAIMTDTMFKNRVKVNNYVFLMEAIAATEGMNSEESCEEIFAMLTSVLESRLKDT